MKKILALLLSGVPRMVQKPKYTFKLFSYQRCTPQTTSILLGKAALLCFIFSMPRPAFAGVNECVTAIVDLRPGALYVPAGSTTVSYSAEEKVEEPPKFCTGANNLSSSYNGVITRRLVSPYGDGSAPNEEYVTTPIKCLDVNLKFRFTEYLVNYASTYPRPVTQTKNMKNGNAQNIRYAVGSKLKFKVRCALDVNDKELPAGDIATATAVVSGSTSANPLSASATIKLSNKTPITHVGCFIDDVDKTKTIPLGDVYTSNFRGLGSTAGTKKDVILNINCGSVNTDTKLKFVGPAADRTTTALALSNEPGKATGVGVQLFVNGSVAPVNQEVSLGVLPQGKNSITLSAQYIQTAANITPGVANARATINVTYN